MTAPPGDRPEDPVDEALERTDLAWDRSALAMAAVGLVLVKQILPNQPTHPALGWIVLVLGLATALVGFGYRRHRQRSPLPSRLALKLVATATAVIGVAAFVVSLVPPASR